MEQDDDLPGRTIPEKPVPGQRYMQYDGGLWAVYDWEEALCERCTGNGYAVSPADPARLPCPTCGGRGHIKGALCPFLVADGLLEVDAHLLVFGGELLAAVARLSAAIAKAKGE